MNFNYIIIINNWQTNKLIYSPKDELCQLTLSFISCPSFFAVVASIETPETIRVDDVQFRAGSAAHE
jgi:hypothetical protein